MFTYSPQVRSGYNSHETSPDPSGVGGFGRLIHTDSPPTAGDGTGKQELMVNGILNLGVRPNVAIQAARRTLEGQGGVVMEGCWISGIAVRMNTTPSLRVKIDFFPCALASWIACIVSTSSTEWFLHLI